MRKIIDNQKLELKYKKGYGAWTYHLVIPNTANIDGKWGSLKVSGFVDNYEIQELNLAPRKNMDKMISINKDIRNFIGKSGGDMVTVTLYLHSQDRLVEKAEIITCFEDAGVLSSFTELSEHKQIEIMEEIISKNTADKQIELINQYIQQFL